MSELITWHAANNRRLMRPLGLILGGNTAQTYTRGNSARAYTHGNTTRAYTRGVILLGLILMRTPHSGLYCSVQKCSSCKPTSTIPSEFCLLHTDWDWATNLLFHTFFPRILFAVELKQTVESSLSCSSNWICAVKRKFVWLKCNFDPLLAQSLNPVFNLLSTTDSPAISN